MENNRNWVPLDEADLVAAKNLNKIEAAENEIVKSIERITRNHQVSSYIDNLLSELDAPNSKLGLVIVFIRNTIFSFNFWTILFTHRKDIITLIKCTYDDEYKSACAKTTVGNALQQENVQQFLNQLNDNKEKIINLITKMMELPDKDENSLLDKQFMEALKDFLKTNSTNIRANDIAEMVALFSQIKTTDSLSACNIKTKDQDKNNLNLTLISKLLEIGSRLEGVDKLIEIKKDFIHKSLNDLLQSQEEVIQEDATAEQNIKLGEVLNTKDLIKNFVAFAQTHKGSIETILSGIKLEQIKPLINNNNNIPEGLVTEELINTIKSAIPNVIDNLDEKNISEILTLFKDGEFKLENLTEENLNYITSRVNNILTENQNTISKYLATNDFIKKNMDDIFHCEIEEKAFNNIITIINGLLKQEDDLYQILKIIILQKQLENQSSNEKKQTIQKFFEDRLNQLNTTDEEQYRLNVGGDKLIQRELFRLGISLIKQIQTNQELNTLLDDHILEPLIKSISFARHYTGKALDTKDIQDLIQDICNDTNIECNDKISELKNRIQEKNLDNANLLITEIENCNNIQSLITQNYTLTNAGIALKSLNDSSFIVAIMTQYALSNFIEVSDKVFNKSDIQADNGIVSDNLKFCKDTLFKALEDLNQNDHKIIADMMVYKDDNTQEIMKITKKILNKAQKNGLGSVSSFFGNSLLDLGITYGYSREDDSYKKLYNKICDVRKNNHNIINVNEQLNEQDSNVILHKKILDEHDFSKCHFTGFNFSETSFNKTDFQDAKFINCNFDNAKLNETNFNNASFDKESFKSLIKNISQEDIKSLHKKIHIIDQNGHKLANQSEIFINAIFRENILAWIQDTKQSHDTLMEKHEFIKSIENILEIQHLDELKGKKLLNALINALYIKYNETNIELTDKACDKEKEKLITMYDQKEYLQQIISTIRKDLSILPKELCILDHKKSLALIYNQSHEINNSSNATSNDIDIEHRDFDSLKLCLLPLEDKFKQESNILTNYSYTTSMSSITFSSAQNVDIPPVTTNHWSAFITESSKSTDYIKDYDYCNPVGFL